MRKCYHSFNFCVSLKDWYSLLPNFLYFSPSPSSHWSLFVCSRWIILMFSECFYCCLSFLILFFVKIFPHFHDQTKLRAENRFCPPSDNNKPMETHRHAKCGWRFCLGINWMTLCLDTLCFLVFKYYLFKVLFQF